MEEQNSLENTLRWCIESKKAMAELDQSLQRIRNNLTVTMDRLQRQRFILEFFTELNHTNQRVSELTQEIEQLLYKEALPYIDAQIEVVKDSFSILGR